MRNSAELPFVGLAREWERVAGAAAKKQSLVLFGLAGAGKTRLLRDAALTMLAAARNSVSLGALRKLFWDPRQTFFVAPLRTAEDCLLFDIAAEHFSSPEINLGEFRPQALDSAQGDPGQIIGRCRLAKFAPLRIDAIAKFLT